MFPTFKQACQPRPTPSGIDAFCRLNHFAIITYLIDVDKARQFVHPRFELETISSQGRSWALLSVVPFEDQIFTSAVWPLPHLRMSQTNYRIYIIDPQTHQRCVWFLGTTLDSWSFIIPRFLWKLPWHYGRISIRSVYHENSQTYTSYHLSTQSQWAPASCSLSSSQEDLHLPFFSNLEAGLVILTHPLTGFYYRRDHQLGSYSIWHNRLSVHSGSLHSAQFDLLNRLQLLSFSQQQQPHSVLLLHQTDFTIYLPPVLVSET